MANAEDVIATVRTLLEAGDPGFSFYDGYVPEKLPMDGEFIRPYVVLWAGDGASPDEVSVCGSVSTDGTILDFQLTAVGATPQACRWVAREATSRLVNQRAGTGKLRPNPDGFNQETPLLDTQVTPARFMLPKQWRVYTN